MSGAAALFFAPVGCPSGDGAAPPEAEAEEANVAADAAAAAGVGHVVLSTGHHADGEV